MSQPSDELRYRFNTSSLVFDHQIYKNAYAGYPASYAQVHKTDYVRTTSDKLLISGEYIACGGSERYAALINLKSLESVHEPVECCLYQTSEAEVFRRNHFIGAPDVEKENSEFQEKLHRDDCLVLRRPTGQCHQSRFMAEEEHQGYLPQSPQ